MRTIASLGLAVGLGLLLGCGSDDPAPASPTQEVPASLVPAPGPQETSRALSPSPGELENAVRAKGISQSLPDLVPERSFSAPVDNLDAVAVRTGVVLSDAILTCRDSAKEDFVQRLQAIHSGMTSMGAGSALLTMLEELIIQVENDTASREEFLHKLDEISSIMVPEDGWGPEDKTGPLLQAGAWLAGSNLVTTALIASGSPEHAQELLLQAQVVDYYLHYVQSEGAERAPDSVREHLVGVLTGMKNLMDKSEITLEDLETIKSQTDGLFSLL